MVATHCDYGVSGAKAQTQRAGLDALLNGSARREFDIVGAWSICRLGRSLPDLIGLIGELEVKDADLHLYQQIVGTSTPADIDR